MFDDLTMAHICVGAVMVMLFGTAIVWLIKKNQNGD